MDSWEPGSRGRSRERGKAPARSVRPRARRVAVVFGAVACLLGSGARAETTRSFIHTAGALPPVLIRYETFDGALGTLDRIKVVIDGTSSGSLVVSGDLGVPEPYSAMFTHAFDPHEGPGFTSNTSLFVLEGTAMPFTPVPFVLGFLYQFEFFCGETGGVPLVAFGTGAEFTPASSVTARCPDFVEPGASGTATSTDAVEFSYTFDAPPEVALFGAVPIFSLNTQVEYAYTPHSPNRVPNGDFEDQALPGWLIEGSGTVLPAEYPPGSGNAVVVLAAASPVSLSRPVDTPPTPFQVRFDYAFPGAAGDLEVRLGGVAVSSLSAAAEVPGDLRSHRVVVEDPGLRGQLGLPLAFVMDGVSGSEAILDNVSLTAVPDLDADVGILLAVGFVLAGGIRRRISRPVAASAR